MPAVWNLTDTKVNFNILRLARKYNMGGAVQHGASTLPNKYFNQFPKTEAIEVHLGTDFQNIIMNHSKFPKELLNKIYI